MAAVMADPLAEERAALAQHRHMERMRRLAEQAREREVRVARRAARRKVRERLAAAERQEARLHRKYGKALTAYRSCSDKREPELGEALERAYDAAVGSTYAVGKVKAELVELS